ncbi:hypothetical protein VKT23_014206 [Stygiomarasmius scandens]|uniref:Uncharacterized protein n=1 Tax=Marasmiellus scandens TaxID=2682957 RepID=A0ABR1J111_9AGAR
MHQGKRLALIQALHRNKIPVRTFEAMKGVMSEGNIADALTKAQGDIPPWLILYLIAYKVRAPPQAAHSMLDLAHTSLSSSTFPDVFEPGLVILTMLSLSRFNLVPQMHPLISRFLALPELVPSYPDPPAINPSFPAAYFNILLLAMTSTPTHLHSTDLANALLSLLKSMRARHVNLWPDTRTELLQDRYLLIQLTKYLRSQSQPTKNQLERDLTLFGPVENSAQFSDIVSRELALTDPEANVPSAFQFLRGLVPPEYLKPVEVDMEETEGLPDSLQARQAIQTMHKRIPKEDLKPTLRVLSNPHKPVVGVTTPNPTRSSVPAMKMSWDQAFTIAARDTRTVSGEMLVFFFERAFGLFSKTSGPIPIPSPPKSKSMENNEILTLPPPPHPSTAHFCTLLNGLLARHVSTSVAQTSDAHDSASLEVEYSTNTHHPNAHLPSLALKYWHALRSSGLMLDGRAVGTGARVLIMQDDPTCLRASRERETEDLDKNEDTDKVDPRNPVGWGVCAAWDLLESFCAPPRTQSTRKAFLPLPLSTISLNDIFVSLNRVGRPDIVMRMWDGWTRPFEYWSPGDMDGGYSRTQGLHTAAKSPPDSRSLCLLIQSVRLAARLDGGLIGTWRQWRELHRLHSMDSGSLQAKAKKNRDEFVRDVESLLWNTATAKEKPGRRKKKEIATLERGSRRGYIAGTLWDGELPIERMRRIMRGVVWGAGVLRAQATGVSLSDAQKVEPAPQIAGEEENTSSGWMQALDMDPPAKPMKELMYPDRWRVLPPLPTLAALKDFFSFRNWIRNSQETELVRPIEKQPPLPQTSSSSRRGRSSTRTSVPQPTAPSSPLSYPRITLTSEIFHEYILLLGTATSSSPFVHSIHDVSASTIPQSTPASPTSPSTNTSGLAPTSHPYHPEIPIVLGWMRHLGVVPKRDTLAACLVFWGEVTVPSETLDVSPPSLTNRNRNGLENRVVESEYEKLVVWIRDWVREMNLEREEQHNGNGENQVYSNARVIPTLGDLAKWRGIIRRIREGRRPDWLEELMMEDVYGEDNVEEEGKGEN